MQKLESNSDTVSGKPLRARLHRVKVASVYTFIVSVMLVRMVVLPESKRMICRFGRWLTKILTLILMTFRGITIPNPNGDNKRSKTDG